MSENKKSIAIIGGCGHVGFPLGIALAMVPGHEVHLVDINEKAVENANNGILGFKEKGGSEALKQVLHKSLWATTDPKKVSECETVILVMGTPVDEHMNPRIHDVVRVINSYVPHFKDGQLIILRSTLFPTVSKLVHSHLAECGKELDLAYCPERVAQGYAIEEIKSLPQIVAAFDKRSEDRAATLFGTLTEEILRLDPIEAELAKLFANSWRYITFAIANQLYMITETYGADYNRIHKALTHNYPRTSNFPKPGLAAGPCLFKDTMQLSAFNRNNFMLGHSAMLINEGLPIFLVDQLERKVGSLEKKKIGILGMAFKANNDDTRDSLSYKIKKILESRLAVVRTTDVYQDSADQLNDIVSESDAIILGVPHAEYRNLDLAGKPFIDCWGAWTTEPDLKDTRHPMELISDKERVS